jgi:hypothetical protein
MIRQTKQDCALFLEEIASHYPEAEKITLVMDNLNTHEPGYLYETFPPDRAKELWDRFEFVYTPKHGSWLNMAEIELNVLMGQCLNRRIDDINVVRKESSAWQEYRNNKGAKVNWQFRSQDARIKLTRLYPTLNNRHDTSARPKTAIFHHRPWYLKALARFSLLLKQESARFHLDTFFCSHHKTDTPLPSDTALKTLSAHSVPFDG